MARQRLVRVAFAATNDHPYQSVGRWLLDQGAIARCLLARHQGLAGGQSAARERAAAEQSALRVLPRRAAGGDGRGLGPRGRPGRGADAGALDCGGSPEHSLRHAGVAGLQRAAGASSARLVLAQDTGSAIVGAVRADYFTGWGHEAGDVAGRLKQGLRLWALWPK